ncbi:MAG: HAMP domain-containing sensor histidine kinase [Patescibacteria group bacterium]
MQIIEIIIFICIIALVIVLFFLSNQEIKKSLEKSKKSEKILEKERLLLMDKIEEQSSALKIEKIKRMNELSKMAEFGRLSQGLFHDLMTPLTSIVLHTEKLKNTYPEEIGSAQNNLEKAVEASRRMASYIQNIRSTMQGEHLQEQCEVEKELQTILDLLSYKIRNTEVKVDISKIQKINWFGDTIKIRQVFSNLISNALDSFDTVSDRERMVEISLYQFKDSIIFKIKDNGEGIPKENREKIFQPFFTTKTREKGAGIGLSTVKSIVQNDLKGEINLESLVGQGSVFQVIFPNKNSF